MSTVDERLIWTKELKDSAQAISEGITDHLIENERNQFVGFCLFLVDLRTGVVQYQSDLPHADVVGMLGHWVNQGRQ